MPRSPTPTDLARVRKNIDSLDSRILALLARRGRAVLQAGKVKQALGLAVVDGAREAEVLDRLVSTNPGPYPEAAIRAIFAVIVSESRKLQGG